MSTYRELKLEIEKLVEQAESARLAEKETVLGQIRALIVEYRLLPEDLGLESPSRKGPLPARFRDPESGTTWSGRGRTPQWLDGQDRAKYAID